MQQKSEQLHLQSSYLQLERTLYIIFFLTREHYLFFFALENQEFGAIFLVNLSCDV